MSYAYWMGTYFARNPLSTELTACFLPLFLSRMKLSHAKMCAWCIVKIIFFLNMHSFVHFGKRIQRVNLFEKKKYFFTFILLTGKDRKNHLAHSSCILVHPSNLITLPILENFYYSNRKWFLFGMI